MKNLTAKELRVDEALKRGEQMFNWEDTVMSNSQISALIWTENGTPIDTNLSHVAKTIAQAQAEISFKAGIREMVEWISQRVKDV